MSAAASWLLAFAGFAALSLAMHRHARDARFGPERIGGFALRRTCGWALLAASLAAALAGPRWSFALVAWIGLLGAAAASVALLLWRRPTWLPRAGVGAAVAGLLLLLGR